MRKWSVLAALVCVFFGCDRGRDGSRSAAVEPNLRAVSAPAPRREQAPLPSRNLVRTVELDLRVADTTTSAETLRNLTAELGGYVGEMAAERDGTMLDYTLTLRIPVDRLDDAVERIKKLAERIDREVEKSEDVTEQHIDLSARLKTLQATETELRGLLSESRQRGSKAEEIMAVYEKLTEIRSGIETLQGQLQALEQLTALSTIRVHLSPTESAVPVVSDGWHPVQTARNSFRALLGAFRTLGDLAIVTVIFLLPIGLVLALPLWGVARALQAYRRKRSGTP